MGPDETLAGLSNATLYSAMLVYTVALLAFAVDLIRGRGARPVAVAEAPRVAAGHSGSAGGTDLLDFDSVTAGPAAPLDGDASRRVRRPLANIGISLTVLATLAHVASVVLRGLSVNRAPWGNMFEYAVAGSAVVTVVYLALLLRNDLRYLGTFVVGPVLLTLGLALTVFYTEAAELVPALDGIWLIIHVSVAFIATALLTIAFSTTLLQLVQDRRETARAAGREPRGGRFMDALPTSRTLDRATYQFIVIAFPLWTFTLIAGAIWAQAAWGRYWGWDPKEVWTFVIWVVYAGYLHAKATRGWDGRKAAYLAAVAYACVLVNFLVVNIFFVGFHSYA